DDPSPHEITRMVDSAKIQPRAVTMAFAAPSGRGSAAFSNRWQRSRLNRSFNTHHVEPIAALQVGCEPSGPVQSRREGTEDRTVLRSLEQYQRIRLDRTWGSAHAGRQDLRLADVFAAIQVGDRRPAQHARLLRHLERSGLESVGVEVLQAQLRLAIAVLD